MCEAAKAVGRLEEKKWKARYTRGGLDDDPGGLFIRKAELRKSCKVPPDQCAHNTM